MLTARDGSIFEALRQAVDEVPETARGNTLVSVMIANNETGVLQPIEEVVGSPGMPGLQRIATWSRCWASGISILMDSALIMPAFRLTRSAGRPVLALLVRPGRRMTSLLRGGGQEQGRRSGTENFLGIAGFGAAAKAAFDDISHYHAIGSWRDAFESNIAELRGDVRVFSAGAERPPNTSCLAIGDRSAETLVMALDLAGVAVSAGSACSSGKVHESHVLKAMNVGEAAGRGIRISAGWNTREADFEKLAERLRDL